MFLGALTYVGTLACRRWRLGISTLLTLGSVDIQVRVSNIGSSALLMNTALGNRLLRARQLTWVGAEEAE